ncbi:drug resistance transporter, EmrB/QacA subfamily [Jatrophihabitans endophyticus]|uniref:Drug resistance transporter, EmrB/QacA subfamily n=1 Tax=Jatrophihabitans endophyticus TaxID=1206085 RepID=A0A1M5ICA1_9ACTN|nr:MFS transporter [Jatrophihabitans endophyticus]SHG26008.1 drug resistance transporter, EmrB/QacA subfamily [Jatrophihabitans endophyticus]
MTDTEAPGAAQARARRGAAHPALTLLVIAGAQMMVVLDGTIVNIALPSMGSYFDKSQTDMTWALNAYTLAFGGLLLLGGRMGDVLGRRRMFVVGLGLFTLGSFLAGVAPNFAMLLVGRAIQGVGGAIASPTALSLITTEFEEGEARTRAIGVYAAVSGAGAALGLLLGGVLTNYLSWRWVLFVNVPIGIALMIGAAGVLHHSERLRGRFDVVGALLSVAGMVAMVYGFIHVAHSGWSNAETVVTFVAAVVLLVFFVYFEARIVADPMMPMRIFENRSRSGAYLVMFVVGAAMFGMFYFVTFFVQGVREYSALKTGFSFLPVAAMIGVVSQVVAKALGRTGPKPLIVTGTLLLTASLVWFAQVDSDSSYAGTLLPGMIVLAVAMGFLFVPLTSAAVSKVAHTDAGLASALLNVGQQVGGALGLSVMTTVFGTAGRNYANSHADGLRAALERSTGGDRQLAGAIAGRVSRAGNNGLQQQDIRDFVASLPQAQQGRAAAFFGGPYREFSRGLLAHASGQGFLMGAGFGVAAVLAAVFLINVKRADVPADAPVGVAG